MLGGCPSNDRCRLAVLQSLGTVMTTVVKPHVSLRGGSIFLWFLIAFLPVVLEQSWRPTVRVLVTTCRARASKDCVAPAHCNGFSNRTFVKVWGTSDDDDDDDDDDDCCNHHHHCLLRWSSTKYNKQESLADAKVSARQQCVYEGP